jgi:hypothetical protein
LFFNKQKSNGLFGDKGGFCDEKCVGDKVVSGSCVMMIMFFRDKNCFGDTSFLGTLEQASTKVTKKSGAAL